MISGSGSHCMSTPWLRACSQADMRLAEHLAGTV
jgi:hypothetical protein